MRKWRDIRRVSKRWFPNPFRISSALVRDLRAIRSAVNGRYEERNETRYRGMGYPAILDEHHIPPMGEENVVRHVVASPNEARELADQLTADADRRGDT